NQVHFGVRNLDKIDSVTFQSKTIKNERYKFCDLESNKTYDIDQLIEENADYDDISVSVYPNPVREQANIDYRIPVKAKIEINIQDIHGKHVSLLEKTSKMAGVYSVYWDCTDENGTQVPNGAYLIKMNCNQKNYYSKIIVKR
ncbi:MAG: FlgD immunoglobulin-like domain containing protein, partial [Cyclobacteriaceae bacterium]